MKRLIVLLALVAGCGGVLVAARNALDSVVAQATADEKVLTEICEAAAEELGEVPAVCDEAWDLYEQMQADVRELRAEIQKPSPDERRVADLVLRLEQTARRFAAMVKALGE